MLKIHPSFDKFSELAKDYDYIPVYTEIFWDTGTPISAILPFIKNNYLFILESLEGSEQIGRYSFIGPAPSRVLKTDGKKTISESNETTETFNTDILSLIRSFIQNYHVYKDPLLPSTLPYMAGFISFDYIKILESISATAKELYKIPEALFFINETLIIFDHLKHSIKIVSLACVKESPQDAYNRSISNIDRIINMLANTTDSGPIFSQVPQINISITPNIPMPEFLNGISTIQKQISSGLIYTANYSQHYSVTNISNPFYVYRKLRKSDPSSNMYFLKIGDVSLCGSSDEMLASIEGKTITTKTITRIKARPENPEEEKQVVLELLSDAATRAEHVMMVDMARNDLGKICNIGSIKAPNFVVVEKSSNKLDLVTNIEGQLTEKSDTIDAIRSLFPSPNLIGVPKLKAIETIETVEKFNRGLFGGCVGIIDFSGNCKMVNCSKSIAMKDGNAFMPYSIPVSSEQITDKEITRLDTKATAYIKTCMESA